MYPWRKRRQSHTLECRLRPTAPVRSQGRATQRPNMWPVQPSSATATRMPRGQPGDRVIPGGPGELAAGGQLLTPPGEQLLDLGLGRRDPKLRFDRGPRPVHLVQRALEHPAGQVVDLGLVPQLQELEVDRER